MRFMFGEEWKPTVLHNGTTGTDPFDTAYVDMHGFNQLAILAIQDPDAAANVVLQLKERKPNGSDAQLLANYVGTLESTEDGLIGIIDLDYQFLTSGYSEVAVTVTPAGDEDITILALLGNAVYPPVDRSALAFYVDAGSIGTGSS